jgi:drug/metabolite transporter (DMT)-like permease
MITGRRMPHTAAHLRPLFVVGALLLVGGNGLVVWSEQWVPSGLAAVMVASVPLFMSSIDSIVPGGHRLPVGGWLGILIGFSGVVLLVYPTLGDWEHAEIEPIGIIGLVLASLFWSSGSVYSKRRSVGGDVLMNSAVQMLAGGVLLFLLGLLFGEFATSRFTLPAVLSLLYLIIFGSIIGFTSYVYLLHHVPPAKASTYAYVNPVVAILLGWLLLAESLELRTIIATAVILAGVAIVQTARTTRSGS